MDAFDQSSLLIQMLSALRSDDVNDMLDALSCFFANIPANITVKREKSLLDERVLTGLLSPGS